MSSSRADRNDIGGEAALRTLSKDNSSNEKIQHFANSKIVREASPIRRNGSPTSSNMGATQKPTYRKRPVRSTLSSRESSPSRTAMTHTPRPSQLQNSTGSSQQVSSERPMSQRTQRSVSNGSQWPVSPRLPPGSKAPQRSPALPPGKNPDQGPPNAFSPSTVQHRLETSSKDISDDAESQDPTPPGMRTPTRNNLTPALETVVESSLPSTPAIGASRVLAEKVAAVQVRKNQESALESTDGGETTGGESTTPTVPRSTFASRAGSVLGSAAESESDTGNRSEADMRWNPGYTSASNAGPSTGQQRVFTRRPTLVNTLSQNPDTSRNMTVETETVTSMIQLGGGTGGTGASIRSKRSTDTIKAPRKEKKKRYATTPANNAASTKAEIFGAQIAAAVHEQNSSDSDETFVYESNPPDQRPTGRFHSRTPSATSIHLHGGPDPRVRLHDQQGPTLSRNKMTKFAGAQNNNNAVNAHGDGDGGAGSYGTIGGHGSSRNDNRGGPPRHSARNGHHNEYNNQRSILAEQSPFLSGHKSGMSHISSKPLSSPIMRSHPRTGQAPIGNGSGSKRHSRILSPPPRYGADEEGDDERMPLIPPRNSRVRRRPVNTSQRQQGFNEHRRRSWFSRFAGCIITVATIILVVSGTVGFMFATSKPLQDVKVLNMTDVLVSQQEIMLDLIVQAMNPNMIGITVQAMDVNMFAKSAWVRDDKDKDKDKNPDDGEKDEGEVKRPEDDSEANLYLSSLARRKTEGRGWKLMDDTPSQSEQFLVFDEELKNRRRRTAPSLTTKHQEMKAADKYPILHPALNNGVDEGTDPDPNLPDQEDRQTMLLGRICQLDSPLSFEASPFYNYPSISKAGLRLARPGNRTESGGTERWERVILHPFELIVRGILKYQLPLSARVRSASIMGSVMVNPADDNIEVVMR